MTEAVLTRVDSGLGRITLNRAEALHALNEAMCAKMIDALVAWREDAGVKAVLIDHAQGTRGFCAGGDIRFLQESGKGDGAGARAFFHTEYRLNHLLQTYAKPVIALMDGVTMGGGVGISAPASFRIATERTLFAMPETGIGLFPDVGGGWHLPRLGGDIGVWLALTGARIKAADCLAAGVCTHYVPSELLGAVTAQITGACATGDARAAIASGLDALAEGAGAPKELTEANLKTIARCFAGDRAEAILAALDADGADWAQAQAATIRTKSPQTVKVALRQLRAGAAMATFAEVMRMEYRIGARVIHLNDFQEGVRAVIIDKDNAPNWAPSTLEAVSEEALDRIFAPLPDDEEWTPL